MEGVPAVGEAIADLSDNLVKVEQRAWKRLISARCSKLTTYLVRSVTELCGLIGEHNPGC